MCLIENQLTSLDLKQFEVFFKSDLVNPKDLSLPTFTTSTITLKYLRVLRRQCIENPKDTLLQKEVISTMEVFGNYLIEGFHMFENKKIKLLGNYEANAMASHDARSLQVLIGLSKVMGILSSKTLDDKTKINLSFDKMRSFYYPNEKPDIYSHFQHGHGIIATAMSSGLLLSSPIFAYLKKIGMEVGIEIMASDADLSLKPRADILISHVKKETEIKTIMIVDDAVSFSATEPGSTLKNIYWTLKEKYPTANFLGSQTPDN